MCSNWRSYDEEIREFYEELQGALQYDKVENVLIMGDSSKTGHGKARVNQKRMIS